MSIIRCGYCKLPMTEIEAVRGNCPSCGGAIDAEGQPAEVPSAEQQVREQAASTKKGGSFWLVSSLAGLLLVATGVWYYFLGPQVWNPEEEPKTQDTKSGLAQAKQKPTPQTQKEKPKSSPLTPPQKTEENKTDKATPDTFKSDGNNKKPAAPSQTKKTEGSGQSDQTKPEPAKHPAIPNNPEPMAPKNADEGFQKLNAPDGKVTFKSLNKGATLKLMGQVGIIIFHEVNGKSTLDASKLQAKEIIFTGGINGGSKVFLNAPKGKVIFQGEINDKSEVQVRAPDGVVIFGNPEMAPGGARINSESQIAIIAREVDIRGAVNGTHTLITVGLNPGGKLRFHALQGAAQLLYKSLDPAGESPHIEAGKILPPAKFEKVD